MRISFLLGLLFVVYSCNNDLNTIGDSMIPPEASVEALTFNIDETSTVRLDSFPTSLNINAFANQLTLGKAIDRITGTITATPYFQIIGSGLSSQLNFDKNFVYDSLTLALPYNYESLSNSVLAGDTSQVQTYYLYRLKKYPRPNLDEPYIYENYKLEREKTPLATLRLRPEKEYLKNNKLYFKLQDSLGRELFNRMRAQDSIFIYPLDFIQYFKGLVIVPDEKNSALIPLDGSSLGLQCHYHLGDAAYTFSLPSAGGFYSFTNIQHTPTDMFTGISWKNALPFSKSQMAVVQGMDGYTIKLKLPYLPNGENRTILKAEIELKPRIDNFENIPEIGKKSALQVFVLDEFSRITNALTDYSGNPVYGILYNNPNYQDERRYKIDITDYYMSMVNSGINLNPQLNLLIGVQGSPAKLGVQETVTMVGGVTTTFDRLIVDEIPILRIYYAKYK